MMDLKNDRNEKETEYSCETGQTDCTENPGHRGCGDILLLGPAKPVAAGGRGGLAAQYPVAASPRLLHGVRAEHPDAFF